MTGTTSARLSVVVISCLAGVAALHGGQRTAGPAAAVPKSLPIHFENIASAAGIDVRHTNGASPEKHMVETMGSGGLFFDFDNDGWIDIFVVDGGSLVDREAAGRARHRLFRNRGNGTFEDVTSTSGVSHMQYGMGACAADYDNDGFEDLYVTGVGSNSLYHNNGDGTFTDVTRSAGVASSLLSTSCAFADFDKDGHLDLFVTRYVDLSAEKPCGDARHRAYCRPEVYRGLSDVLFHNNGDGTFTDVSRAAGIEGIAGKGLGVVVADYDDDGWPDVFVANDLAPNFLFHNKGRGVFSEEGLLAGVALASDGKARAGMGTDFGDYDGDGFLDLIVTNFMLETHSVFRGLGRGLFADATFASGIGQATLPFVGFGTAFLDYDNDGSLDVAIANGHVLDNADQFSPNATYAQRKLLFHNEGHGRFAEVGRSAGAGFAIPKVGRSLAVGDIDNDGDLDLLITNNGQTVDLLRNDGGSRANGLLVQLVGRKSNRDGIGAVLRLTAGGRTQIRQVKAGSGYLGQSDHRVHFGLGGVSRIDTLEIRWPSGAADVVRNPPVNHIISIVEGIGITGQTRFATR